MGRPCPLRPANSHSFRVILNNCSISNQASASEWEKCPIYSTSFILIWVDKICCYHNHRTTFRKNLELTHFLIDIWGWQICAPMNPYVNTAGFKIEILTNSKHLQEEELSWLAGEVIQRAIHQRKSREVSFFMRLTKQSMMSSIQFTEDINYV